MARASSIAVVATACRLPDANSPEELWANIVEGRRSFRAVPRERLDLSRYAADVLGEAESITPIRAGLLTNWRVDRRGLRIPKKTFAGADLTHWLALQLAAEAIESIGGPDRLDRARTAVIVANTLTGEFSRAGLLRLRLPFLEDVLTRAGDQEDVSAELASRLRSRFAAELRTHFPEPNEESLAGGLANTIAGRIANYFDLRGGAYSIDGACASSLVALADAANLLLIGHADAIVVTAVDLSLDPFELVGFSRNGALAADEMRVFDARANGFWPGEGGACVLLMREDDAVRHGLPVAAKIRGWGLSSDGAGGLTRPSSEGQLMAYRRAYAVADVDPADIAFVEAHGTGTAVGDPVEVRALAALRDGAASPLLIGSIKANIGHTKAAAGLAGVVKTVEALRHGLIPPHVSCEQPHPIFAELDDTVRPIIACEPIDDRKAALAGVSSFGFGGINTHIILERAGSAARPVVVPRPILPQDAELFLFSGDGVDEILAVMSAYADRAPTLSMSELVDAAAHAAATVKPGAIRVAVVAANGSELVERLARGKAAVVNGETLEDPAAGLFVGRPARPPRIGFLFPGQGAPYNPDGGSWSRRFPDTAGLLARLPPATGRNAIDTEIAQPGIVAASLAALRVMDQLGISAGVAAGHSLGEITALVWAGALDQDAALDLAQKRGAIMARLASAGGAMLRVELPPPEAERLAHQAGAVLACRNGKSEAVLSGSVDAIAIAAARCKDRGIEASRLPVSHAFHSPHMNAAAAALAEALEAVSFGPVSREVASTVTGEPLTPQSDLCRLLVAQLTMPVLFDAALAHIAPATDYLVEVGPGFGLSRLAKASNVAAYSVDAFGRSLKPLLLTTGALFAAGVKIRTGVLLEGRSFRAFDPAAIPRFIASPCGTSAGTREAKHPIMAQPAKEEPVFMDHPQGSDPLTVALHAIAHETGLAASKIGADDRFLDTLHLNSLAVTRIVTSAARALGTRVPSTPTEFANATARQLAEALAELRAFAGNLQEIDQRIVGVRPWVRTYGMQWADAQVRAKRDTAIRWTNIAVGQQLPSALERDGEVGLLIWLDGGFATAVAEQLVALASEAARSGIHHLALCHNGAPIAAFARSTAREAHFRSIRVIDRAHADAGDPRLAAALAADVSGYYEVRLGDDGAIQEPVFVPTDVSSSPFAAITTDDVVVIVGGGKGIAAECGMHAAGYGATIVLVGRSAADDPVVAATLARGRQDGLRCYYVCADVLKPETLTAGLAPVLDECGPATTLIYAAGANEPKRLTELDIGTVQRTLALKTAGLQSTLAALGPSLHRLITFGSIIGRIGLEGEAHYALANAMQSAATAAWAAAAPGRAALAIEWSIWGGTGMGERLGTIERLSAQGVDAISVDDALIAFDQLIARGAIGTVAVTSRFGPPADLSIGPVELPMLRFVDEPKVHFPGVELVIDTALSRGRDPYLDDHVVGGDAALPAVMALEAMAQVACALSPLGRHIVISNVAFRRMIHVPPAGATQIRIAALRTKGETVDVNLFADDDDFTNPCMEASFGTATIKPTTGTAKPRQPSSSFPAEMLYGPLFFNGSCFQRLDRFESATSRRVAARIRPDAGTKWFGSYEPSAFVLWDPGATDSVLHALQVAVPQRRVVPVSVAKIEIDLAAGPLQDIDAVEKNTVGSTYTFDLLVNDADGRLAQRWTDVTFQAVDQTNIKEVLAAAPALACPYLERVIREAVGDDSVEISIVCQSNASRETRRDAVIAGFGMNGRIDRRADGRPIRTDGEGSISIANGGDVTLAIAATNPVGCDIEKLGTDAELDITSVRRHTVVEACRKLGRKPLNSLPAMIPQIATRVGDLAVMTVDLPLPSGSYTVAVSSMTAPNSHRKTALREVEL